MPTNFESTPVFTGRYGLGSKDTTPAQIVAVYENTEKQRFTIGIVDDVTNLSLPVGAPLVTLRKEPSTANSGDLAQTVP